MSTDVCSVLVISVLPARMPVAVPECSCSCELVVPLPGAVEIAVDVVPSWSNPTLNSFEGEDR